MSLPIISADQRLAERRGIKGAIFGKSGIGKTTLLLTMAPATTLFFDLEAGDLAIEGWGGDSIRPRTWQECRDIAVFIGGPNPALRDDQPYSQAHFDAVCDRFGEAGALGRFDTVVIHRIPRAGPPGPAMVQGPTRKPFWDPPGPPRQPAGALWGLHGPRRRIALAWGIPF
uniref:Uncharacterized protein n=1 Tax=Magnetospirillum gryphiswaldense TaxID=55518 RepID=A4U3U9_9PROT|nr:conserved hypothetical protein [Magnetospirillum gryphiswaldense MSR-1]